MKLVGYQTSHKEIRDLYHSVYLFRRLPGPLPCGPQQRMEAIHDILSSLRNHLHCWVYPIAAEEDTQGAVNQSQSRPRGRKTHMRKPSGKPGWPAQRALEAAQVLESNIERLSQGLRDVQQAHLHRCNSSCPLSQTLDRQLRSPSRP